MNSALLEVMMAKNNNRKLIMRFFESLTTELDGVKVILPGGTVVKDPADKIIKLFIHCCGGCRIRVPDHNDLYIMSRNRAIRRQREKGVCRAALAIEWNMSPAQLGRILKKGE